MEAWRKRILLIAQELFQVALLRGRRFDQEYHVIHGSLRVGRAQVILRLSQMMDVPFEDSRMGGVNQRSHAIGSRSYGVSRETSKQG